jgi:hypothetical protein
MPEVTMRCPVCRADNAAQETTCRRCRADLSLLAALEEAHRAALHSAAQAAAAGDGPATLAYAQAAHELRPERATWRWLAIGHFLQRDFMQALAHYQRALETV